METMRTCMLLVVFVLLQLCSKHTNCDMIFEMKLNDFKNPTNRTYLNNYCFQKTDCNIGFVFCLIDLPFRNPQNCTLGDYTTPVIGKNDVSFAEASNNFTYQFTIKPRTPQGIGMMVEVRDYSQNASVWQPLDFYTSALADVPLFTRSSKTLYTIKKRFYSLFNHNTSLNVQAKLYCAKHYFGPNCEVYCNENFENFYSCDAETGAKHCKSGFVGEFCHIPDICKTVPCLHNGTCISSDGLNYTCNCPYGYSGDSCEITADKMLRKTPNKLLASTTIMTAKSKPSCETYNPCKYGKCYLNEETNELACICNIGYMGPFCDLITHPCDFKPCMNDGICEVISEINYKCTCQPKYSGKNCETQVDACQIRQCRNGAQCVLDEAGEASCKCDSDYTGTNCEYLRNPCQINPCQNQGTCNVRMINQVPMPECTCDQQFFGNYCEKVKRTCNETECFNGARCIEKDDYTTECQCKSGFYGENCENDVDECTLIGPCKNEGQCLNLFGSFECMCPIPYAGTLCDEKTDPCKSYPCNNNGKCRFDAKNMTINCECPRSYTGEHCDTTLSICETGNKCSNNGTCVVDSKDPSVYTCKCTDDFSGKNCDERIHICEKSNPCLNHGQCVKDAPNGTHNDTLYKCNCPKEYHGLNCEIAMAPTCDNQTCLNDGICLNLKDGDFKCECKDGFYGLKCEHDIDICQFSSDLCKNNGTCVDGHGSSFHCICANSFTGPICDVNVVNPSSPCLSEPCKNGGKCKEKVNGTYKCSCTDGHTGLNCESKTIAKVDKCKGYCLNNGSCSFNASTTSPQCSCAKQYTGLKCESLIQINPCTNKKCLNGASCRLIENSTAQCVCKHDFTGEFCENVKKTCKNSEICLNNGTCVLVNSSYTYCSCGPMFTGPKCELVLRANNLEMPINGTPSISTVYQDSVFSTITPVRSSITHSGKLHGSLWLLIVIFGYIFGLFIIFIIIWFIWHGYSYKRQQAHNILAATTSSYNLNEYSPSTSLHRHTIGKRVGDAYGNACFRNENNELININTFSKIQPAQRI